MLPLFFAFLAPFLFGAVNMLDKFIMVHKVKHLLGYIAIDGLVAFFLGSVLALGGIYFSIFPILAGFLMGLQAMVYFLLLQKEDVSYIIGLI